MAQTMPIATIETIWRELQTLAAGDCQRRVDATHPHDLYLSFAPPDRVGILALCQTEPADIRPLHALSLEHRRRADLRWSLQIDLLDLRLASVFAAFCSDIVAETRGVASAAALAPAIVERLERWRHLLEPDPAGLGEGRLRGLIAELLVLEHLLSSGEPPHDAVAAWVGPLGSRQDFALSTAQRIEVKAVAPNRSSVEINGLAQLDSDFGPIELLVVTLLATAPQTEGAFTAADLVARLRGRLAGDFAATEEFSLRLARAGWHDHPAHSTYAVRLIRIDSYDVSDDFPTLTRHNVPAGVESATYRISLPAEAKTTWRTE